MRQEVSFTTFIAFITEEGEKKDEDTFVYALLKKRVGVKGVAVCLPLARRWPRLSLSVMWAKRK
jgi:hypothetical protein